MSTITLEKMGQMKLLGMQRMFQSVIESNSHQSLTADEFISMLIQSEWEDRESRKLKRRLRFARFRSGQAWATWRSCIPLPAFRLALLALA